MKTQIINYFPKTATTRPIRERYWIDNGVLVDTYESFYKNGQPKVIKEFNPFGDLRSMLRFRPDGTRITKLNDQFVAEQEVTLTAEELESAIETYQELRKRALNILLSRKIRISACATDKSLLRQFKEFEENRFSF